MKILISLNNYLQDVLELTPVIDLITLFYILNIIFFFNYLPLPQKIVFQTVNQLELWKVNIMCHVQTHDIL